MDAKEKAAEKATEKTTKKIKFTENVSYPQSGPDGQLDPKLTLTYAKGSTYEVDNAAGHADRWIRRGVAVEVDAKDGVRTGVMAQPKAVAVEEEEAADYEAMSADEVHKIAADRSLEGRAGLNKADTIKLIEKDDKAAKKAAAPAAAPVTPPAKPK